MPDQPSRVTPPPACPAEVRDALGLAIDAALAGGRAALRFYGNGIEGLGVRDKGPNDPVTNADHAANDAILELLAARNPGIPVLSEESPPPEPGVRGDLLWVVDPLDGTKEFISRNGEFAVMVGLACRGRCRLGAVYRPDPGEMYAGVPGAGAWICASPADCGDGCWRPLHVPATLAGPLRLIGSRSHADPCVLALARALGDGRVVPSGSVGIKCARIAVGSADLYVHPVPYLKEWDTCAPEAVLVGAGGVVTDCAGDALTYGKPCPEQPCGIFAAPAAVWSRVRPAVREACAALWAGDAGE